jgi:hypothetical protein
VEVLVVGTQHVSRAALGGLQDIQVVGIAQRRMIRLAQDDSLGNLPEKLRVIVKSPSLSANRFCSLG